MFCVRLFSCERSVMNRIRSTLIGSEEIFIVCAVVSPGANGIPSLFIHLSGDRRFISTSEMEGGKKSLFN